MANVDSNRAHPRPGMANVDSNRTPPGLGMATVGGSETATCRRSGTSAVVHNGCVDNERREGCQSQDPRR
eukprot:11545330-Alexandrium_andersonii.AAC.1